VLIIEENSNALQIVTAEEISTKMKKGLLRLVSTGRLVEHILMQSRDLKTLLKLA
jgi:hypothetical protein